MRVVALLIPAGQPPLPTHAQHNGLVDLLLRNRLLGLVETFADPPRFSHPWRVRAQRFAPPPASPLDGAKTWRVDVRAGSINDRLPTLLYLRTGDPRGWVPPPDYYLLQPGDQGYDARWIERDALDDPDDPPCLVLRDPDPNAKTGVDFTLIPDALRNGLEGGAFCGEEAWELELWRAHVILSATPLRASIFDPALPPPRLARYRLYATRARPAASVGAGAGGWLEVATLYLLRSPAAPDDAQLLVRQREFWPLWGQIVQPGSDLAGLFGPDESGLLGGLDDLFGELAQQEIDATLADAATTEFWTV